MIKFNQFIVLSFDLRRNAHISTMHERWWWQNNRNLRWKWKQNSNKENNTKRSSNGISAHQFQRCVCVSCSNCESARDETTNIIWFVIDGDRCVCPTYSITYRLRLHMRTRHRFVRAFFGNANEIKSCWILNCTTFSYEEIGRSMHTMARCSHEMARVNCTNYDDESNGISRNVSYLSLSLFTLRSPSITSRTRSVCDDEWAELLVAQITREVVKP